MRQLELWVRRGLQHPGRTAFLLLSLSVSLAASVAALSLKSWRALPFLDADALVKLEVRNSEGQLRWWSWRELQAVALDAPPSFRSLAAAAAAALMRALRADEHVLMR